MKKKIIFLRTCLYSLSAGLILPTMISCCNKELSITLGGSRWGYVISDIKPYFEYQLILSKGFKKNDILSFSIVNPSIQGKIKISDDTIWTKIDGDDVSRVKFKVIPTSEDPQQDPFTVQFGIRINVNRNKKEIYSTQIDSLIFDVVKPAINPDYYTYSDADRKILTGINVDKHYDDLLQTGCLVIPPQVETIASKAFSINPQTSDKLKNIYKSNKWILLDYSVYDKAQPCSLKEIQQEAFFLNTYFIEALYIPSSVTSIGNGAFSGCSGFNQITFASQSKIETIGNNAFQDCLGVQKSFALPNNNTLTQLSSCLFATLDDSGIPCEKIKIPSNISTTSNKASFFGFKNLKEIDLSDFKTFPSGWTINPFLNPAKDLIPTSGTIYVNDNDVINLWKECFKNSNLKTWDYVVKK